MVDTFNAVQPEDGFTLSTGWMFILCAVKKSLYGRFVTLIDETRWPNKALVYVECANILRKMIQYISQSRGKSRRKQKLINVHQCDLVCSTYQRPQCIVIRYLLTMALSTLKSYELN